MIALEFDGSRRQRGALRVSEKAEPGVAVVADLERGLPFKDDSVEEVYLDHTLEDARDFVAAMREIWRICRPGALVHVWLPHASSTWATSRNPGQTPALHHRDVRFLRPGAEPGPPDGATFEIEQAKLYLTTLRLGQRPRLTGGLDLVGRGEAGEPQPRQPVSLGALAGRDDRLRGVLRPPDGRQGARLGRVSRHGLSSRIPAKRQHERQRLERDPLRLRRLLQLQLHLAARPEEGRAEASLGALRHDNPARRLAGCRLLSPQEVGWRKGIPLLPFVCDTLNRLFWGVVIGDNVQIGRGLCLVHGYVVIDGARRRSGRTAPSTRT